MEANDYPDKLNCFLIGPSGTGKTFLMRSMAKELGFPLICLDANELTPTGNNSGVNSSQLRKEIYKFAENLIAVDHRYHSIPGVLEQLVIFVDEFDKLGTSFDASGNWNKHVQSNFLTMIEDKDDLSGVSWVFAGAFSDFFERKASKKEAIGFFSEKKEEKPLEITEEDILKAGIIPEMLGRISLIVQLDTFGQKDYENIATELLNKKYARLKHINISDIAAKALSSGQGVRSVIRQLETALIDQESDTPFIMPTF